MSFLGVGVEYCNSDSIILFSEIDLLDLYLLVLYLKL